MSYADIIQLKSTMDALFVSFPELREDEILRADVLEGQTDLSSIMKELLNELDRANAMITGINERANQLNARKARFERHVEGIRSLIETIMNRADLPKLMLPEATLSVGYRKPSPFVVDEDALPETCVKTIRKADMASIKALVENGQMPAGVAMSNGKNYLTIRFK